MKTPCHPDCRGWFMNVERETIERCDDCARFKYDEGAARQVRKLSRSTLSRIARAGYPDDVPASTFLEAAHRTLHPPADAEVETW